MTDTATSNPGLVTALQERTGLCRRRLALKLGVSAPYLALVEAGAVKNPKKFLTASNAIGPNYVRPETAMTPRLQDYLDAINALYKESGRCKLMDIAERVDVQKHTVHSTLTRLIDLGLVKKINYGSNLVFYEPAWAPDQGTIQRLISALKDNEASLPPAVLEFKEVWQ